MYYVTMNMFNIRINFIVNNDAIFNIAEAYTHLECLFR